MNEGNVGKIELRGAMVGIPACSTSERSGSAWRQLFLTVGNSFEQAGMAASLETKVLIAVSGGGGLLLRKQAIDADPLSEFGPLSVIT